MSQSRTAGGALTATREEIMALSLVLMVGAVGEAKWPPWLQTIPGEALGEGDLWTLGWGEWIPVTVVRVRSSKHLLV